jgi:hypothetical protein
MPMGVEVGMVGLLVSGNGVVMKLRHFENCNATNGISDSRRVIWGLPIYEQERRLSEYCTISQKLG